MLVLASTSLVGSLVTRGWLQSVLIELALTFFGVLITVFYVERLVDRHEEQRWAGAKEAAVIRLRRIGTRLVHDTTELFPATDQPRKFPLHYWKVRAYPDGSYWREFYENPDWLAYVRNEVIPSTPSLVDTLSDDDLARLADILRFAFDDLKDVVTLFPGALSPAQLENISAMMSDIRTQTGLIFYKRGKAPNRLPPDPAGLLQRSLALITERG